MKFSFFKQKEAVIRLCYKLKDTGVSVSEDYAKNVQFARKKLLEFARTQGSPFKLRFDKLVIGDKQFHFNYATSHVYEAAT